MFTFCALFFVTIVLRGTTATKCNGLTDLCNLRIDQVTFPGSHNAGSGFDGLLHYWSGGPVSSCFYRNHGKSFKGQLEFGIRYFDIDTCYGSNKALNCHCGGGACAYAGSIKKGLKQIDTWMKSNPNEVIVIHFNRDAQENYRKKIAEDLVSVLWELWQPNGANKLAMSTYYKENREWPTLKMAISSNQRIFVFMDNNLSQHITRPYDWFVRSNNVIKSTWESHGVTSSCSGIVTSARKKCDTNSDFIEVAAFASRGLCTWDMARLCSKWLGEAQDVCYGKREPHGKTVNFLAVDWVDYGESVVNKAKFMNQINIRKYLG